jgi:hypothetical protein
VRYSDPAERIWWYETLLTQLRGLHPKRSNLDWKLVLLQTFRSCWEAQKMAFMCQLTHISKIEKKKLASLMNVLFNTTDIPPTQILIKAVSHVEHLLHATLHREKNHRRCNLWVQRFWSSTHQQMCVSLTWLHVLHSNCLASDWSLLLLRTYYAYWVKERYKYSH